MSITNIEHPVDATDIKHPIIAAQHEIFGLTICLLATPDGSPSNNVKDRLAAIVGDAKDMAGSPVTRPETVRAMSHVAAFLPAALQAGGFTEAPSFVLPRGKKQDNPTFYLWHPSPNLA